MTQQEDIKNEIECMRKGGVILYPTDKGLTVVALLYLVNLCHCLWVG